MTRYLSLLLVASAALVPPAASAQPAQDFSTVQIKTAKVAGNVFAVEGQGGTIGALVGPDGVFLVDSQYAPLTERIVAAIRQLTDRPIRFLVNTHQHPDHTGGNENFAKLGVTLIARPELRARLAQPPAAGRGSASPAGALPMLTYTAGATLHMNGEEVRLIPVPVAHTDGDTMVYFKTADVLMTGDFYRSMGYPNIDRNNGGSLKGLLAAFQSVIELAGPNTRIIPGHGAIVGEAAVAAHRDMTVALRDRVAALVKEGKTLEQIVAAKPTADYDAKVPQPGTTGDRFVGQLFAELAAAK